MSETTLLTRDDLKNIPQEALPMPVLSDNLRSFFSWGIKVHEKGCYNHYMWLIKPEVVATQNTLYTTEAIANYTSSCRLKFWYCKTWTPEDRKKVLDFIQVQLDRPWYNRLYNVPAIFGQLVHLDWIRAPWLSICSDYGHAINLIDKEYNLKYPDPEEVNHWLEERPDRYEVYGRYLPD